MRTLRKQITMLLAGITMILLSNGSAVASCGDYLFTKHDRPMKAAASQDRQSADSAHDERKGFVTADDSQPCSGPGCRNGQRRFPSENPANVVQIDLRPGVVSSISRVKVRPDRGERIVPRDDVPGLPPVESIERPPL